MGHANKPFNLSASKAEVLEQLRRHGKSFHIQPLVYFPLEEWRHAPQGPLDRIFSHLGWGADLVAVRSSAHGEDGAHASQAGAFLSLLGVTLDVDALTDAVERVVASMPGDARDQVIVQKLAQDMEISGVVLTHGLDDGAPYCMINYDDQSGRTDTVTGGIGVTKSVLIHESAKENQLQSDRLKRVLRAVTELEGIIGAIPLDIEFGLERSGVLHIFQVRRIATERNWDIGVRAHVNSQLSTLTKMVEKLNQPTAPFWGGSTVLANMTDWNPAEMIGQVSRPLATSLYQRLITKSVWRDARARMGYRRLSEGELMVVLAGHPYIDVRASFNSFLPEGLNSELGQKIVDLQLERLRANPALHDKVEFEITPTVLTFTTHEDLKSWYGHSLSKKEQSNFIDALRPLTEQALDTSLKGSLSWAEARVAELSHRQSTRTVGSDEDWPLEQARNLLDETMSHGTLPFAMLSRHCFIAEAILRTAVSQGAISLSRLQSFKRSVKTIAGEMAGHYCDLWSHKITADAFLARYGHLRPSTYDISSLRYDQREDLFASSTEPPRGYQEAFAPRQPEISALQALLESQGLGLISAENMFDFASRAIVGREYGKFIFTKNISDALECIARWGEAQGVNKDELSFLRIETILEGPAREACEEIATEARDVWTRSRWVRLSYIIRDPNDLIIVPSHRSDANFIGGHRIEAQVVHLGVHTQATADIQNKIVCIESADPGFDWIFTQGIAGLVTRFGGANSHMAIRCSEFGLPAAIGCGELMFNRVANAKVVDLNCPEKKIRVIR